MLYLLMVKFVSFKEMLQNTEEFVQKGAYKTVCHGTSVKCDLLYDTTKKVEHTIWKQIKCK